MKYVDEYRDAGATVGLSNRECALLGKPAVAPGGEEGR
jgi:predicted glycosyltransferase